MTVVDIILFALYYPVSSLIYNGLFCVEFGNEGLNHVALMLGGGRFSDPTQHGALICVATKIKPLN